MYIKVKYYILLTAIFLIAGYFNLTIGQELTIDSTEILSTYNYLLMLEADSGNTDKVLELINLGADPNTCDGNGVTPLMFAAQSGNAEVVKLLIDKGANVNASPPNGNTALHAAVRSANDSIAELLIQNGANINAANAKGLTPLHYAVWLGLPYLTQILIYYGSDLNAKDYHGNTPLILSTYTGAKLSTRLLLENGADPDITNSNGVTPLMVAAQFNDSIIFNYLISYGADLTLTDDKGANAQCFAIANRSIEILKNLYYLDALNHSHGKSYYQIAREYNSKDAMQFLAENGFKTRIKPSVSSVFLEIGSSFASHEFLMGYYVGIAEQITQTQLSFGYLHRPTAIASLTTVDGQLYQYWEYRQVVQANLRKNQTLINANKKKIVAFAEIEFGADFRNYRGTSSDPKTSYIPAVSGGLSIIGNTMEYSFGFGYNFNKELGTLPYIYTISARIHFNVLRPRVVNENIKYVR